MTTEDCENVFAVIAFVALVALAIAGCCWHASIVDRAAARHFACVDEQRADGLTTRQARDACIARNR